MFFGVTGRGGAAAGDAAPPRGIEQGSLILKLAAGVSGAAAVGDSPAAEAGVAGAGAMAARALGGAGRLFWRPPGSGGAAESGWRTSSESTPLATACWMADEWLVSVFMMRWWVRWAPGGRLSGGPAEQ